MTAIGVPLVSVVVPTYNRADMVLRAVRSILAQTERDFEVLIVDDGSTDDTMAVLAFDDPRIHVLETAHAGVGHARNLALGAARGTWVAFLDDDDEWRPTYLERQLSAVVSVPEAVAVYCPAQSFDDDAGTWGELTPWYSMAGDLFAPMMRRGYPRPTATMVRRATLAEVGGFAPDLPAASDCELLLRVGLRGMFAWNPEPLAIRHRHGHGQLSTQWAKQRDSYWIQAGRLQRAIVRRGGYRAWATWLRWHAGEAELAVLWTSPIAARRALARSALGRLARYLPWSAPAMVRPMLLMALGARPATSLRRWYRAARRAGRVVPRPARGRP